VSLSDGGHHVGESLCDPCIALGCEYALKLLGCDRPALHTNEVLPALVDLKLWRNGHPIRGQCGKLAYTARVGDGQCAEPSRHDIVC